MQVENIFPNPILRFDLSETVRKKSLDIAIQHATKHNWFDLDHFGNSITTYHDDLARNYCGNYDSDLADMVILSVRSYLNNIGYNPDSNLRAESWLNLNLKNTHHSLHEHYGSFISAVVWLQTNENSGNFTFHEPLGVKSQNFTQYEFAKKQENQFNFGVYSITPISGQGVVFQSWMPHQVYANKSDEHRYSVAFNIWIER